MGTEDFDAYRVLFVIISEAHINLSWQKMYLSLLNRKKRAQKGWPICSNSREESYSGLVYTFY